MTRFSLFIVAALALGGCGQPPPAQVVLDTPSSDLRLRPQVRSVEVREVSLPRYATTEGVNQLGEDGLLITNPSRVWADDPDRAMTLGVTRNLSVILGTRVAAEPWPFAELPGVTVRIVVEQMLASAASVRLQGAYAIAPVSSTFSDRDGRFDITVPVTETVDVARAHGLAVERLSEQIAGRLGR